MRTAWSIAVLEILDLEVEKRFTSPSSHHTEIDILQFMELASAMPRGRLGYTVLQSYSRTFVICFSI
jgi:hypothetical protein